jgi:hypothetical protein
MEEKRIFSIAVYLYVQMMHGILMKESFRFTNFTQNNPPESKYIAKIRQDWSQQSQDKYVDGSINRYIIVTLTMCMQRSRGG